MLDLFLIISCKHFKNKHSKYGTLRVQESYHLDQPGFTVADMKEILKGSSHEAKTRITPLATPWLFRPCCNQQRIGTWIFHYAANDVPTNLRAWGLLPLVKLVES